MDWTLFWAALGALATFAMMVGAIWAWIWRPYTRSKEAVISFMADLSMRHVLYEEVGVEQPDRTSASLEQIRTGAAYLYGVLSKRQDKIAAAGIREASREAALAIREKRCMPGAREGGNWFEDNLNAYRDAARPLVETLCNHYRIPSTDRPRITSYRAGFPGPGISWEEPGPDEEQLNRLLRQFREQQLREELPGDEPT